MHIKRYILLIIVIISSFFAKGQNSDLVKNLSLKADYGYGFIMPHHQSIEYFLEDHIRSFDLKLEKLTNGEKYWNQLFRFPHYGLGYYRSNLGNNKIYGNANALYTYAKIPILGASNKLNLSWQFAFGASYITKIFDIADNPQNLAIGSHLNIFIDISLHGSIPLTNRLTLNSGVRVSHFSNGKMKSPNKGLNILTGSLGFAYHFDDPIQEIKISELPSIRKKNEYSIVYAGGVKTISEYEQGYYFASSLIFNYNRNYSLKGRWSLGTDIFFDQTSRQYSENIHKADVLNSDLYQIGLNAGHELVMGKISLLFYIGAYIYAPVEVEAPIYSRTGLRYRINEHLIINYTLKAHWAQASYVEWGIGYVF